VSGNDRKNDRASSAMPLDLEVRLEQPDCAPACWVGAVALPNGRGEGGVAGASPRAELSELRNPAQ